MDRREFLRRSGRVMLGSGVAAAIAGIPACTSNGGMRPTSTPARPSNPSPSSEPRPPTDAEWQAFGRSLDGTLVRPGDAAYPSARLSFNPRFDRLRPQGIAVCASPEDVQRSVAFVREHGLPIAPRAGGHSYGGYSTGRGLVCDVGRLARVSVDAAGGTATVGAGARLVDVYAGLAPHGVAVPAGSCPTVGLAGLALGGGVGVIGRRLGLTCDNVREVQIVTAGGDILTCDQGSNADLLWACQGGGGGNFGVVTSFTFRLHAVTGLTLFSLTWPWPAAAQVVAAWQDWAPGAPDELWSTCHLLSSTLGTTPTMSTPGVYVGAPGALGPLLADLQRRAGVAPTGTSVTSHSFLDAMLIEGGCSGKSIAQCHLSTQDPQGTVEREASRARSDFFTNRLPSSAIGAVVSSIEHRQADPRTRRIGGVVFDALGGAINRVGPAATAFFHRNALFLGQYVATWPTGSSSSVVAANIDWLSGLYTALRPAASGFAYQNYIDPDLGDWQHAYYGDNFARLVQVKATYDPDDVFHFAQSIPVA